ncbi:hypothetical protein ISCGN_031770 [Ixodes scapularis]
MKWPFTIHEAHRNPLGERSTGSTLHSALGEQHAAQNPEGFLGCGLRETDVTRGRKYLESLLCPLAVYAFETRVLGTQQEEQLELRRGQQEGLSKQLDGELQRWEEHRQGALRKVFLLLAEQQLQCLQQCLSAWEGALVALRKPDSDGTADAST